jgi:hypothetical protein
VGHTGVRAGGDVAHRVAARSPGWSCRSARARAWRARRP